MALYQCCACKRAWKAAPGAWGHTYATGCPGCGSQYYRWVNYNTWSKGNE